jgi:hypothetical protein
MKADRLHFAKPKDVLRPWGSAESLHESVGLGTKGVLRF